jgi:transposase
LCSVLHLRATAESLDIYLVFLPPYSSDLNPEEYLWKSLKRKVCAAFVQDLEAMKATIQRGWKELSQNLGFARYWFEDFLGPDSFYIEVSL